MRLTQNILFLIILLSGVTACKKNKDKDPEPVNCAYNSGSFEINVAGEDHELQLDSQTNFTIVYNWFGYEESAMVIIGKDQNAESVYIEMAVPGIITEGSTSYNNTDLDFDFFDIDLDTNGLYVSEVTFDVVESQFDSSQGIYTPIRANFSGTAHSYPWVNGQPPSDTQTFSGSLCLNGLVM
ncbi:MAG: hypothetical protein HUJ25_03485 [Crocinitomicaceae bacterium]|nr:hypothetical protein [Crocinitomicaceae bacterium]